jgi:hypothetical protein
MNNRIFFHLIKRSHLPGFRILVISIIFLLSGTCFLPSSLTQTIPKTYEKSTMTENGQILFAPMWNFDTYLLDYTGTMNHTWPSNYLPGVMVRWFGDGTILRTIRLSGGPGASGGVQKVLWDGSVVWDFRYNTDGHLSHHDIQVLPNGNVLMIAWETKTQAEVIVAGRNPDSVPISGIWPDHVIEVQPTGPTSGNIVWEWHVWDHLIQDYDSSKANYGVVGDHPELLDINFGEMTYDWLHTNSIDYNEKYDQILLSVCYFNEIWVIDHSTTTEEAAGHTGGNSGRGGDLLYRWGNPQAYRAGTASDQKFFLQHDATWIKEGYPGSGDILVFNNGKTRPGSRYSSVDEIIPPFHNGEYYLEEDSAYGPLSPTWSYTNTGFYGGQFGGATRLASGDTLITNGETGKVFEVTPEKVTVWQYNVGGQLFKVDYIPAVEPHEPNAPDLDCSGSLSWNDIKPGTTVTGSFQLQNIGGPNSTLNWTVDVSSITWGNWTFTPESGENLAPDDGQVTVHVSVVAPSEGNSKFDGYLRVENRDDSSDYELIPVYLKTPETSYKIPMFYQFFMNLIHLISEKIFHTFQYFFKL